MSEDDLDALARRAAEGEDAAFHALRAALSDMTLRYFEHKVNDAAVAARLVDETFATARDVLIAQPPEERPIRHWFLRHARNTVIAYYQSIYPGPWDAGAR